VAVASSLLYFGGEGFILMNLCSWPNEKQGSSGRGASAWLVVLDGVSHGWRGDQLLTSVEEMLKFLDENLKK
jgi:hypothetical protein